jgi:uncharacterized pyridoxal phosphate-containing UPF0001 family protein
MPNEVLDAAKQITQLPGLIVRGLMAIPQVETEFESQRQAFVQMRQLFNQVQAIVGSGQIDTLSIGMSADLEAAIAEGSTQVRIGTDLFGTRQ